MARKPSKLRAKRSEKALALALKLGGASAGFASDALLQARLRELAFGLQQESYREPLPIRVAMLRALSDVVRKLSEQVVGRTVYCDSECTTFCGDDDCLPVRLRTLYNVEFEI